MGICTIMKSRVIVLFILCIAWQCGSIHAKLKTGQRGSHLAKRTYYQILNVANTATNKELKRAYRAAALTNHPDKFNDPVEKSEAEAVFMKVVKAYEILIDPMRRNMYDRMVAVGLNEYDTEAYRKRVGDVTNDGIVPSSDDDQDYDFAYYDHRWSDDSEQMFGDEMFEDDLIAPLLFWGTGALGLCLMPVLYVIWTLRKRKKIKSVLKVQLPSEKERAAIEEELRQRKQKQMEDAKRARAQERRKQAEAEAAERERDKLKEETAQTRKASSKRRSKKPTTEAASDPKPSPRSTEPNANQSTKDKTRKPTKTTAPTRREKKKKAGTHISPPNGELFDEYGLTEDDLKNNSPENEWQVVGSGQTAPKPAAPAKQQGKSRRSHAQKPHSKSQRAEPIRPTPAAPVSSPKAQKATVLAPRAPVIETVSVATQTPQHTEERKHKARCQTCSVGVQASLHAPDVILKSELPADVIEYLEKRLAPAAPSTQQKPKRSRRSKKRAKAAREAGKKTAPPVLSPTAPPFIPSAQPPVVNSIAPSKPADGDAVPGPGSSTSPEQTARSVEQSATKAEQSGPDAALGADRDAPVKCPDAATLPDPQVKEAAALETSTAAEAPTEEPPSVSSEIEPEPAAEAAETNVTTPSTQPKAQRSQRADLKGAAEVPIVTSDDKAADPSSSVAESSHDSTAVDAGAPVSDSRESRTTSVSSLLSGVSWADLTDEDEVSAPTAPRRPHMNGWKKPTHENGVSNGNGASPAADADGWTDEQLTSLRAALTNITEPQDHSKRSYWVKLSALVPGKTSTQCRARVLKDQEASE